MSKSGHLPGLKEADLESVGVGWFRFAANLRSATNLVSYPRRAVSNPLVRVRKYSSFQTGTSFLVQNTYISEFCSCCKGCSLACIAFRPAMIASERMLIAIRTYIFLTTEFVVSVSEVAAVTLGTVASLHVVFTNLRLKKKADLLRLGRWACL